MAEVEANGDSQWMPVVLAQLAPRFDEFVGSVLRNDVEPAVQKSLSKASPEELRDLNQEKEESKGSKIFKFEKIDLGSKPPKITNIVAHGGDKKKIVLDFDVSYVGDADLQVRILGIHSGVKDVQLEGRGRLVMRPLMGSLPLIGGVQFGFLEPPKIEFDLEGLANICDWPGLRSKVRREISASLSAKCVYPNRMSVCVGAGVDPEDVKAFKPEGILFVRVERAQGLPKKGGLRSLVGQDRPDPYAKVQVGTWLEQTGVVKNSCEPDWTEENKWFEFPLDTVKGLNLNLRLFDHDSFTRDDFLGKCAIPLKQLSKTGDEHTEALLDDPNEKCKYDEVSGEVTVVTRWLECSTENVSQEPVFPGQVTVATLNVFVYSCNNLVVLGSDGIIQDDLPTTKLTISLGSESAVSDVVKRDPDPRFEFGAFFKLNAQHFAEAEEAGVVAQVHDEKGTLLCELRLPLNELIAGAGAGVDAKRRLVQLEPEQRPYLTMSYSARIAFLNQKE